MGSIFYIFIFVFGLIVGSFLNCVIYRLEEKESFLKGRSYCPKCRHKLSWLDLIPVFSFLILRGKCRYCSSKIAIQYILVELSTAILFLLLLLNSQNIPYLIYGTIITSFLIIIFVYDLKYYIIPDRVIFPAILAIGIWYLLASIFLNFYTRQEILNVIFSAFGTAGFFLFIILISKGKWMGLGDVKLAFLMGLFLGFPKILLGLILAFWSGAIIGIITIILKKKKLSAEIPFAPFLVFGTLVSFFWGQEVINWYLGFL